MTIQEITCNEKPSIEIKVDGKIKQLAESIRNLMDSLKYSYDEACDVLKVEDKEKYRNLI